MSRLSIICLVLFVFSSERLQGTSAIRGHINPSLLLSDDAEYLIAKFPSGAEVNKDNNGLLLLTDQTKEAPTVSWKGASPDKFYTVMMIDGGVLYGLNQDEYLHWLVGNVPGDNVMAGETLCSYIPPKPVVKPNKEHQYILIAYDQPSKLSFNSAELNETLGDVRTKTFKLQDFLDTYNLPDEGNAGSYFVIEYK